MSAQDRVVRLLRFRYATAALVLLAALAVYGLAGLSRPDDQASAKSTQARLTSEALACPAPGSSRLSLLSPAASGQQGRAEVSTSLNADGGGSVVASVTTPGTVWNRDVQDAPDSYIIRAQGALAAGLQAERTRYDGKGGDRGLAGTSCARPGTDLWFVGPGPVAAEDIAVYLTNVDAQQASVDLTALSGEGPLDTVDGRGTPVEPYTTKVVHLGDSAEGLGDIVNTADLVALRVRATAGRVAAAVRVTEDERRGVDWLASAGDPATSLVVPGVPGGQGGRRLLVAVPGQADARVRVQMMTATGAFAPEGQGILDAPAQTVTPLDLEGALSGKPAGVLLSADRPILAAFTAERREDVAYGTATPPLGADGGLVADNRYDTALLLTAPQGEAVVRVSTVTSRGAAGTPKDVKVAAGRTAEVKLAAPEGADGFGVLIVPRPGSGPVHAARVMSTGSGDRMFTVLPVLPAVTTITLPPVADTQDALTGG